MRQLSILNIVQRYYPSIGGSERYFKEIAERLTKDGHKVTVFTTDAFDLEHLWKNGKRAIDNYKETHNGVEIERFRAIKFPFHNLLMRGLYQFPFLVSKAFFSLPSPVVPGMFKRLFCNSHVKFDIIHVSAFPYNSLIYLGILYAKKNRLPIIVTPFLHLGEHEKDKMRKYYTRDFQMALLKKSDKIIVQTDIEGNYLKNIGIDKDKICLLGQAVNIADIQGGNAERFKKKYSIKEKKIVFHVGAKSYDKGTFHLIEAMEKIWERQSDIKLILAGPSTDGFKKYFSEQDALTKNRTLVIDYIEEEDKKDLFAAGDVFVMPSRTDSFGVVFLEAWANKKPVIGANAGGIPEVIKEGEDGYLVKFGDISHLAHYIELLLYNKQLANAFGERGYFKVKNALTWDIKYDIFRNMLHSI